MDVIILDFETYYSTEYSLTRLTTEEYINHPEFEVIGVSVKVNDDSIRWVTGSHTMIHKWLRQFDWGNAMVVSHNQMFDGAVLAWRFGIYPKAYGCTLSMARALHPHLRSHRLDKIAPFYGLGDKGDEVIAMRGKRRTDITLAQMEAYGEYCKLDTALCYGLFNIMLGKGFPKKELKLIDMTLRMFIEPVFVLHEARLQAHLDEVRAHKAQLMSRVQASREALMSNEKFAEELRGLGVVPPTKISARTGKESYAFAKTDKAFLALKEHEDDRVQALVAARLGVKTTLEETRTERMIDIAQRVGTLAVPLRYCAAHTARWGGSDKLNMQNLSSRGKHGGKLKSGIIAPPGYVILNCDSSQIEARTLAWWAMQDDLVAAFAAREDVYKIMAGHIYGKDPQDITADERFMGKTVVLGCGYGMSHVRFRESLHIVGVHITEDEARFIIRTYRETYSRIQQLWWSADKALAAIISGQPYTLGRPEALEFDPDEYGFRIPDGLWQSYEGLETIIDETGRTQYQYPSRYGMTKIYGAKLVENLCQYMARMIIAQQMLWIQQRYPIALTVHDAAVLVVPENAVYDAASYTVECMRRVPDWCAGLPLDCEIKVGRDYGRMKQIPL